MRRKNLAALRTERDIEAACREMDARERELVEVADEIADGEYEERMRWAPGRLDRWHD